jgi:uncharacterized Ntn-hydrolase superfamily protein
MPRILAVLVSLPMLSGSVPHEPELVVETNTFSIVVADPRSREVAVAGASCVRDVSIIGSTIQNVGAAATQASFSSTNKSRVEQRLRAGDTSQQVIAFVTNPARDANRARRQYGVVTLASGSAGFTGSRTSPANGHRLAPFVTVQGNLLVRTAVLDSILNAYVTRPNAPLITRLLEGLRAGQQAGGDARCRHGADSSFLRIRRSEDTTASYASLVVTNPSSGPNPNDPIAQLGRAVASWRAERVGRTDRWVSTAQASPAQIPANGSTTATLTITVRDAGGAGLAGRTVRATGQGIGTISALQDRGNGVYTATVRASTTGTETFTITADGVVLGDRPRVRYTAAGGV